MKLDEKWIRAHLPKDRSLFNALNTVFTVLRVTAVLLIAIAIVLFLNT